MLYLFNLGPIEISFSSVLSFLVGILLGLIIMGLIYALLVVISLKDKKAIVKTESNTLKEDDVLNLIEKAKEAYSDKDLRKGQSKLAHCKVISNDLVLSIASSFYPNSKEPLAELSIEEGIMLIGYVQKRIDELLDKKALRLVKRVKIGQIITFTKTTTKTLDSKFVKTGIKYGGPVVNIAMKTWHAINPVSLFKKAVTDNVTNIILNRICLSIISIVGEEAYKIYSKSIFNETVEIESNIDLLIDSLGGEVNNIRKEAMAQGEDFINNLANNSTKEEAPIERLENDPALFYKRRVYTREKGVNSFNTLFDSNMKYKHKDNSNITPPLLEINEGDGLDEEEI